MILGCRTNSSILKRRQPIWSDPDFRSARAVPVSRALTRTMGSGTPVLVLLILVRPSSWYEMPCSVARISLSVSRSSWRPTPLMMNLTMGCLDFAGMASPPIPVSLHLLHTLGMSEGFSRLRTNPAGRVVRRSRRRMEGNAFENALTKEILCCCLAGSP